MTDDLRLDQYAVAPLTPGYLDAYYAARTPETQQLLLDLLDLGNVDPYLPSAAGTWGRGSHAHGCSRSNALETLRAPEDHPFDGLTMLNFATGNHFHATLQVAWHTALHDDVPCDGLDCKHGPPIEQTCDLRPEWDFSGHIDLTVFDFGADGEVAAVEAVEIKSASDYSFKQATGEYRGRPGPKLAHVVQATEYAMGVDADRMRMIYVGKGKMDQFAEWVIPIDVVRHLAIADLEDQMEAKGLVEDGVLPARWQVEHGVIDNPPLHKNDTGKWGKPFFCSGCRWNGTCRDLPSSVVPLDELPFEVER